MTELPKGWSPTTVKELAGTSGMFVDGDWVESKDQDPNGAIRLLQLADIGDGTFLDKSDRWINDGAFERLRCTELVAGDVLIARMPDPLGRACLMPAIEQRCVTVVDVAALRVDPQVANQRWAMHAINAPQLRAEMNVQASGTTRKRISRGNLGNLQIPLPPAAEQKRIADKLDTVLTHVDAVNTRLARVAPILKRFRQSVLAAATSGRLTEDWRGTTSNDATVTVDSIEDAGVWPFNAIPSSWMLQSFADCFTDSTDSAKKVPQAEYLTQGEIPVVDQGEKLIGGFVNDSSKQSATRLPAIVFGDHTRCIKWINFQFAQGADGVKVLSPKLGNDRYGWVLLKALVLPDKGYSRHFKYLKRSVFPVPPVEEQTEIVRRVETLFAFADRLEARLQTTQTAAHRLTPALLAKAFRGELVPQDPNDEPASELLKRLASITATVSKRGRRSKAAE